MKIAQLAAVIALVILYTVTAFCDEKQVTLQDAYAAALMTNENIKIAEEGVVQTDSQVDQAPYYPRPSRSERARNRGRPWPLQ